MRKIHKNITIDKQNNIIWFHVTNLITSKFNPNIVLIPVIERFTQLNSYIVRIEENKIFKLRNISSISECEINFSTKKVNIFALGRNVEVNQNYLQQFAIDCGFDSVGAFFGFYEEFYRDLIHKDDNFSIKLLIIYCV